MSPSAIYSQQKFPLLIIGQETNGWLDSPKNLQNMLTSYEKFNVGETYRSSPFWSITRKLESILGNERYSCAWTNLSKFDVNNKRATGTYEKAISTLDNLLIDEIKIVTPSICRFLTGPAFDERVKRIFPSIEFVPIQGWNSSQFCKLKHPYLPEHTYRSYHPKSLRLRKLESNFINFFSTWQSRPVL